MGRADYRRCRNCGRSAVEVGELSHTRLCSACGVLLRDANNDSIHEGHGPGYERRRYGYARKLFGPRVAHALKQAGVLDSALLDDVKADA